LADEEADGRVVVAVVAAGGIRLKREDYELSGTTAKGALTSTWGELIGDGDDD